MATASELKRDLAKLANPKLAAKQLDFYQTQKGGYGEGDKFLGLRVPDSRRVASRYSDLSLTELVKVARSQFHEERFAALVILNHKMKKAKTQLQRKEAFDFYMKLVEANLVNNWDLVDASAPYIGQYLLETQNPLAYLKKLGRSKNLWTQRVSIMFLFPFIRTGNTKITFELTKDFLDHPHDLIHKAAGWMLREAGKRDLAGLRSFLSANAAKMPRTMLRYSIEKLSEKERKKWMSAQA